jgi:TonB-dependent receptor
MKFGAIRTGLLLCFLFLSGKAFSQTQLTGKVTDARGALPGASIKLKNHSIGTTSGNDGTFRLTSNAIGGQTLIVSYIGYLTREITVSVNGTKTQDLGDLILQESQSSNLKEVVIGGAYKPSQARALSIKKSSISIAEVLASDAIGKLPDRNAAEAVQRLQGVSIVRDMGEGRFVSVRGTPVEWSASTLNGNRMPSASGDNANRGLQMDIFPSELIEYVKLSKAITPDMDGDAIGGSVDFITKSAPSKRTLALNLAGGYANQAKKGTYNGSFVYGDKITDKLKFITSGVIWDRTTGIDAVRGLYNFTDPDPIKSYSINRLELRDYIANRRTLGFNGALDYTFNPNNKIYFKGLYSKYLDQQTVRETYFNYDAKNATIQARHADYVTDLHSLQLGGESKLADKLNLTWSVSNAKSSFKFDSPGNLPVDERGYPIVNFIQPMTYNGLSADGKKYWKFDSPDGVGDEETLLPQLATPMDASQAKLNQVLIQQRTNSERDYKAQFDLNYVANEQFSLKFGGKYSNKKKNILAKTLLWVQGPGAAPLYMASLDTERFPYNGGFLTELNTPYNNVILDQITNGQIDQMYTDQFRKDKGLIQAQGPNASSNLAGTFSGTEQVYAAYFMGDYKISDQLRLTAGIRNEYNAVNFKGKKIVTNAGGTSVMDTVQQNNYNAFLPMVHLKYSLSDKSIIRFALTRTFARPNFDNLNPATIINQASLTISQGNKDLKPTFSNNADFMFEHYLDNVGIITAGAFYKDLKNVIYQNQSIVNIGGSNYTQTIPDNIKKSWMVGLEAGLSKRFSELPGVLGKLGFEGNYTYIHSKMELPYLNKGVVGTVSTTLPNQAKHSFNLVLFYESEKFMARLAGNFKGKFVSTIRSTTTPDHYQILGNNFTTDFSSSYALSKKTRLFLELNNLTNEPNRYYLGDYRRIEELSYFSFRGQLGVSINLF